MIFKDNEIDINISNFCPQVYITNSSFYRPGIYHEFVVTKSDKKIHMRIVDAKQQQQTVELILQNQRGNTVISMPAHKWVKSGLKPKCAFTLHASSAF